MSNALAIAHVTQALALLIGNNLQPEIDMAVSVETRKPYTDPPTDPTITVFLYQVTPNPSMRNNDLVTRASDGTLLKRPAAALDLHFLISAYGEESELVGQRLIGSVVRTLHEIPILPKDVIEAAAERPYLAGSDLAESPQKVRFSPTVMDVDETSKLWGMLHQTPYSLSVVYQAALVLIEGREKPVPATPVRERTVRVLPFGAPGAPEPPTTAPDGATSADTRAADSAGAESGGAVRASSGRADADSATDGRGTTATVAGPAAVGERAAGRAKAEGGEERGARNQRTSTKGGGVGTKRPETQEPGGTDAGPTSGTEATARRGRAGTGASAAANDSPSTAGTAGAAEAAGTAGTGVSRAEGRSATERAETAAEAVAQPAKKRSGAKSAAPHARTRKASGGTSTARRSAGRSGTSADGAEGKEN
ncbi:Pvc16 family protein [Streptomyces sp. KR80]|uniref:Pvc16 family protein n=1 Tax=Streptomyces sp. KR80 TaxID=3457426 RepID=UPI003FD4C6B2